MNSTLPEMLHSLQSGADSTVLERQQTRLKWQIQQTQQQIQTQQGYLNDTHFNLLANSDQFHSLVNKVDPGLDNGWLDFGKYQIPRPGFGPETPGFEVVDYTISRTTSCPPAVVGREMVVQEKMGGRESLKKRKADKAQNSKVVVAEETREKRSKVDSDNESKVTGQNSNKSNSNTTTTITPNTKEVSGDSSKENSKVSGAQKTDYIHVRARRGQATDSHSLAERVRREKISERMKYLQDLVPGCNKITGKAGMLDEIINYVQSLQRQVEFLSMKLAAVNPRLDFNIDNFFAKEIYQACNGGFSTVGMSPEIANCSGYLPFNPVQQLVSCSGLDMVINPPDMALQRSISAPIPVSDATLVDTPCFTQNQLSTWENDLQNLYNVEFNQGRSTSFPPQLFTETLEANNLKMEM